MQAWLSENWEAWEADPPEWLTDQWKHNVLAVRAPPEVIPRQVLIELNSASIVNGQSLEQDQLVETEKNRRNALTRQVEFAARKALVVSVALVISYIDMVTSVAVGVEYLQGGYQVLGWTAIGIQGVCVLSQDAGRVCRPASCRWCAVAGVSADHGRFCHGGLSGPVWLLHGGVDQSGDQQHPA